MGVFLRVDVGSETQNCDVLACRFVGAIVGDALQPLTGYRLVHPVPNSRQLRCVALLDEYPRWPEPGLALLGRLLHQGDDDFLLKPLGTLPLQVTLSVGANPLGAVSAEDMLTERSKDGVRVAFTSSERQITVSMVRLTPERLCARHFSSRYAQCSADLASRPLSAGLTHVAIHPRRGRPRIDARGRSTPRTRPPPPAAPAGRRGRNCASEHLPRLHWSPARRHRDARLGRRIVSFVLASVAALSVLAKGHILIQAG
jgi:hypothetical protein